MLPKVKEKENVGAQTTHSSSGFELLKCSIGIVKNTTHNNPYVNGKVVLLAI